MGTSRTTWLKFPMKFSDIMDNDSWRYFMFQDGHPKGEPEAGKEVARVMMLLTYMRARTTHLGYMSRKGKVILYRGKREIPLSPKFKETTDILVKEGMLEMDVDPYDPALGKQAKDDYITRNPNAKHWLFSIVKSGKNV